MVKRVRWYDNQNHYSAHFAYIARIIKKLATLVYQIYFYSKKKN